MSTNPAPQIDWRQRVEEARARLKAQAAAPPPTPPSQDPTEESEKARRNGQEPAPPSSLPPLPETPKASADRRNGREAGLSTDALDFSTPARMGRPSKLSTVVRMRVIELFAQFQTYKSVANAIHEEFGLTLTRSTLAAYDCDRPSWKGSARTKAHFDAVRAAYVQSMEKVSVTHQAHRLAMLADLADKATTAKDFANAIKALELAAKEMGGVLTNVSHHRHSGAVTHRHLSAEDARAELAMRLGAVIDGGTLETVSLPAPVVATEGEAGDNVE